jgi:hypothetical protein
MATSRRPSVAFDELAARAADRLRQPSSRNGSRRVRWPRHGVRILLAHANRHPINPERSTTLDVQFRSAKQPVALESFSVTSSRH